MLRIDQSAPIYPVDPEIALGEFERIIMGERHEVVGVFGATGRLVLAPKAGGAYSVSFVEEECPFFVRSCVTHNHPSGSVFSPQDATLASERELDELRAVCPDGRVYSLSRPTSGWPDSEAMLLAAERAWEAISAENMRRIAANEPILKGTDRHAWMFRDQRDAFGALGVGLSRSDVWQM